MNTLFRIVLEGMQDNNEINGAQFSDWDMVDDAIDCYKNNFDGDCPEQELQATRDALKKIIDSNGELLDEAIDEWNMSVWGQKFSNNNGAVAFDG